MSSHKRVFLIPASSEITHNCYRTTQISNSSAGRQNKEQMYASVTTDTSIRSQDSNKVITTIVIRPLDDPTKAYMMCSIGGRRFGCNFKGGLFDPRFGG